MNAGPRCALLVIDLFSTFAFSGGPGLARRALQIAPNIAALRARFDQAHADVIHANDNFGHWQDDLDTLVGHCRKQGGAAAELARQLSPADHHLRLLKPRHSALHATPLPVLLEQRQIRHVVLAGLATDACILATAMEANMRGLHVWVPSDAVAARTDALHQAGLHILRHGLQIPTIASHSVQGLFPKQT